MPKRTFMNQKLMAYVMGVYLFLDKAITYKTCPVLLGTFINYLPGIWIIESSLFPGFILINLIFQVHYLFCDVWIY